jgi:hypothetical protein
MINRIIEFCAHNKFIVLLIVGMATLGGWYSMRNITLDAIPDLSDTQVIIYSRWDRSPDIMEDQVTYPIISAMLGVPKVKDIRGFSDFGFSYVYIIFEDGTDFYWARSRTLEYLSNILPKLPQGVNVELARDETAVGWVFQYALVDASGKHNLAELRSLQDWHLRYAIQAVPGVAEVAPIGGFVRQYQVNLDPNALLAYKIPLDKVVETIRQGNNDVGGRLVEFTGREYMVRGRGYIRSTEDVENIVVAANMESGAPVLVKHLGAVTLGPDLRRGIAELDGQGETVGAIVIMRSGENALRVIERPRFDEDRGAIARSDCQRNGHAVATDVYDRGGGFHRLDTGDAGGGHGRRSDQTDRRAAGRRHVHVVRDGAGGLSGDLLSVEVARRSEAAGRKLMSEVICKSRRHDRDSRKMVGRKMKAARALIAIFLPGIFLLPVVCRSRRTQF